MLALALLIAFNAFEHRIDERARESATMFAYGVRRRTVLGMAVAESAMVGLLGTVVGVVAGYLVLRWMFGSILGYHASRDRDRPVPGAGTLAVLVVLGVLAVALAPLLNVRRLRRMDIPATLRVVE